MARPRKTGLDYFPFDCDFFEDRVMIAVAGEFGIKGEIVTVKLLCEIYRNGYFVEWDDLLQYKLAHLCEGVSAELVGQIATRLVRWGFFDEALFGSAKVLTSADIQERYFNVAKFRITSRELPYLLVNPFRGFTREEGKRHVEVSQQETRVSQCEIPVKQRETRETQCKTEISQRETIIRTELPEMGGIAADQTGHKTAFHGQNSVSQCKTPISQCETPVTQEFTPQIKVNKRKVKRKNSLARVEKNAVTGVCPAPSLLEVEKFFKKEALTSSPLRFFNYYQSRGWMSGKTPVADWMALAMTWDSREKDFTPSRPSSTPRRSKSEIDLLKEAEKRRALEAKEASARAASENPEGLTPSQALAAAKARHGIDPSQPLLTALREKPQQETQVKQCETAISHCEKTD